jgi:hypothetical protein
MRDWQVNPFYRGFRHRSCPFLVSWDLDFFPTPRGRTHTRAASGPFFQAPVINGWVPFFQAPVINGWVPFFQAPVINGWVPFFQAPVVNGWVPFFQAPVINGCLSSCEKKGDVSSIESGNFLTSKLTSSCRVFRRIFKLLCFSVYLENEKAPRIADGWFII